MYFESGVLCERPSCQIRLRRLVGQVRVHCFIELGSPAREHSISRDRRLENDLIGLDLLGGGVTKVGSIISRVLRFRLSLYFRGRHMEGTLIQFLPVSCLLRGDFKGARFHDFFLRWLQVLELDGCSHCVSF